MVREAGLRSFEILRRAGARVGFGTDLLGSHRQLQVQEFRIRAEAERPADIVRSVTSVNADLLRRPDLGRIVVGATADLIVVDGDPLADIGVLAGLPVTLRLVVTAGRVRVEALAPSTDGRHTVSSQHTAVIDPDDGCACCGQSGRW